MCGFAGLFAGYIMGIFAGLRVQYPGWLSEALDLFAGLTLAGTIVVDILLSL